jgi:hypothetical protein
MMICFQGSLSNSTCAATQWEAPLTSPMFDVFGLEAAGGRSVGRRSVGPVGGRSDVSFAEAVMEQVVPRLLPPPGRAARVDPIQPTLKAPGIQRLRLKHDIPLSSIAFKVNLRRYNLCRCRCERRSCRPRQGLTLVHISAQREPFMTHNTLRYPLVPLGIPWKPSKQILNAPLTTQQALTLSREVDECKLLV